MLDGDGSVVDERVLSVLEGHEERGVGTGVAHKLEPVGLESGHEVGGELLLEAGDQIVEELDHAAHLERVELVDDAVDGTRLGGHVDELAVEVEHARGVLAHGQKVGALRIRRVLGVVLDQLAGADLLVDDVVLDELVGAGRVARERLDLVGAQRGAKRSVRRHEHAQRLRRVVQLSGQLVVACLREYLRIDLEAVDVVVVAALVGRRRCLEELLAQHLVDALCGRHEQRARLEFVNEQPIVMLALAHALVVLIRRADLATIHELH